MNKLLKLNLLPLNGKERIWLLRKLRRNKKIKRLGNKELWQRLLKQNHSSLSSKLYKLPKQQMFKHLKRIWKKERNWMTTSKLEEFWLTKFCLTVWNTILEFNMKVMMNLMMIWKMMIKMMMRRNKRERKVKREAQSLNLNLRKKVKEKVMLLKNLNVNSNDLVYRCIFQKIS